MKHTETFNHNQSETEGQSLVVRAMVAGGAVLALAGCNSYSAETNEQMSECQTLPTIVVAPRWLGNEGYSLQGGNNCAMPAYDADTNELVGEIPPQGYFLIDCLDDAGQLRVTVFSPTDALGRKAIVQTGEDSFEIIPPPEDC